MMVSIKLTHIFMDCKEPLKQQEFYHKLTGLEKCEMYDTPGLLISKNLMLMFSECDFDYIPPIWPEEDGKQQKHFHLDFGVEDLDAAIDHAEKLGAVKAVHQYGDGHWVTLLDPEGHPFCFG